MSALFQDLASPSWEVRRRAHLELVRRGRDALEQAAHSLAKTNHDDPAYSESDLARGCRPVD